MKLREKKIKDIIREAGIDGLIVSSPENFHYITGMGSHQHTVSRMPGFAIAIVSSDENVKSCVIGMDFEEQSFKEKIKDMEIKKYDTWVGVKDWDTVINNRAEKNENRILLNSFDILVENIKKMGLDNKTIGLELDFLPVNYFNMLKEKLPNIKIENSSPLFLEARSIKTSGEIEKFRELTKVVDEALTYTSNFVRVGVTEKELIEIYRKKVMESGICVPSHWSFFTTGKNGSRLALSENRKIEEGDVVKFDGGVNCEFDFYTTDTSRTWIVGKAHPLLKELKDTLVFAQKLMIDNMKPGVPVKEIFDIGFKYVKDKYNWYERGHLGHSISMGPGTAEFPFIARHEERVLKPGMILCVETPAYIDGVAGYNIEDMVLITETGSEILTYRTPHYLESEK